ncbi:MAG: hypothetical protein AAF830_04975 [Pseudomonadota bacterium]
MIKTALTMAASLAVGIGGAFANTVDYNYGSSLTIDPAGGTAPFTPRITMQEAGTITDLDVYLTGFSHESWREVDIVFLLRSEDDTFWERAVVLRSEFSLTFDQESVSSVDMVFDDEATLDVPVSGLMSGTFKPTDRWDYIATGFLDPIPVVVTLAEFADGLQGDRTFALFAFDYFGPENGGSIVDWGLRATLADTQAVPLPGVGLALGFALVGLVGRQRS